MKEENIKKDYLKSISIIYLIIFCTIKTLSITKLISNLSVNSIMFFMGCIVVLLMAVKGKIKYPSILYVSIFILVICCIFNFSIETVKLILFEVFYLFVIYNIAKEYFGQEAYIRLLKIIIGITFCLVTIFYIEYIYTTIISGIQTKAEINKIVFTNINGGVLLASLSTIFIYYLQQMKEINNKVAILLQIYYLIFIFISKSRTVLLALVILISYALYQYILKKYRLKKIKRIVNTAICVFMIFIVLTSLMLFLKTNYDKNSKIDNIILNVEKKLSDLTSIRYLLWKNAIQELVSNNLFFGEGENYKQESFNNNLNEELIEPLSISQKKILAANNLHNGYIQILFKNGLLGFGIIIAFLVKFIKDIEKLDNSIEYYKYIKYLYLFYIVINLFENELLVSNSIFVIFLWMQIGKDSNLINNTVKREKDEGIF